MEESGIGTDATRATYLKPVIGESYRRELCGQGKEDFQANRAANEAGKAIRGD